MLCGGRSEVAEMCVLDLVQTQCAGQRVEHLVGDVGLASLFEAAVVVGAQAGQYGQLLPSQSRHATGAGEGLDARLGRGESVPAGAQERPERGAVA